MVTDMFFSLAEIDPRETLLTRINKPRETKTIVYQNNAKQALILIG